MRGLLVLAALTALMVHPVRAAENAAVETLPESSPAVEEEIIARSEEHTSELQSQR